MADDRRSDKTARKTAPEPPASHPAQLALGSNDADTQFRLYRQAAEISRIGGWERNADDSIYRWTPEVYEIFGVDMTFKPSVETVRPMLPHQGFEKFQTGLRRHPEGGPPFEQTIEIRTPSNVHKIVRLTARRIQTEAGERVIGTVEDVTEKRVAETALQRRLKGLQAAIDSADLYIWRIDLDAGLVVIDEHSRERARLNGWTGRHTIADVHSYLHPEDRDRVMSELQKVARTGEPIATFWRIEIPKLGPHAFDIRLSREIDEEGGVQLIGVTRDITLDHQRQADLEKKKREAETVLAGQKEFVARMSHEIRTPMNGVIGMLEVLRRSGLEDKQAEHAETALNSARNLLHLLDDVIDLSLLEARQVRIHSERFQPRVLIGEVVSLFAPRAAERGLELQAHFDVALPDWIEGDTRRLRQVLTNLIGNAMKFTEKGGVDVYVEYDQDKACLCVLVRDTGAGMTEKQAGRVFDKFYQAESAPTRRRGGSGLGLTISKQLVEMMGGEIFVKSAPGEGSDFSFNVPAPKTDAPQEVADAELKQPHRALRILVAEDNKSMQQILTALLTPNGHAVSVVGDGQAAVAACASERFDVVLMDVMMPVMDGVTAARRIRELGGRAGGVPIIALTANALAGDRDRYIAAGMTDYLAKPIDVAALLEALARAAEATA